MLCHFISCTDDKLSQTLHTTFDNGIPLQLRSVISGTDKSDSPPNSGNFSGYTPSTPCVKMCALNLDDHLI